MAEPRRRVDGLIQTLIEARLTQKLSVLELARRTGLARASLYNWEGGTCEPHFDGLRRWAAGLGLTPTVGPTDPLPWMAGYQKGRADMAAEIRRAMDKITKDGAE